MAGTGTNEIIPPSAQGRITSVRANQILLEFYAELAESSPSGMSAGRRQRCERRRKRVRELQQIAAARVLSPEPLTGGGPVPNSERALRCLGEDAP